MSCGACGSGFRPDPDDEIIEMIEIPGGQESRDFLKFMENLRREIARVFGMGWR